MGPGRSDASASSPGSALVVGVLSDTHGHLYPRVKQLLEGADHIIHAGDIGSAHVLAELRTIAPVTAVRGNCDDGAWAQSLSARAEVELEGARILVGHVAGRLRDEVTARAPEAGPAGRSGGFAVVISGHSHLASVEKRGGVLYLNPGSAGPRRFGRPRTVARLEIRPRPGCDAEAAARPGAQPGAEPEVSATLLTAESEG